MYTYVYTYNSNVMRCRSMITTHPVAFSSSHCMHKQVYASFDSLASASAHPATRGFGRRRGGAASAASA